MVDLNKVNGRGKSMAVPSLVLPQVTTDLPSRSVLFNHKWKHLSNIRPADPDFATPGSVYLLLGADVFGSTMLHARRFGPLG